MGRLLDDNDLSTAAEAAWVIAASIDDSNASVGSGGQLAAPVAPIDSADWNDLGEVTVRIKGRTFRAIFDDITDEETT